MFPTKEEKLIKGIKKLSDKYHSLSLLMFELSQSLKLQYKQGMKWKELKGIAGKFDFKRIEDFNAETLADLRKK